MCGGEHGARLAGAHPRAREPFGIGQLVVHRRQRQRVEDAEEVVRVVELGLLGAAELHPAVAQLGQPVDDLAGQVHQRRGDLPPAVGAAEQVRRPGVAPDAGAVVDGGGVRVLQQQRLPKDVLQPVRGRDIVADRAQVGGEPLACGLAVVGRRLDAAGGEPLPHLRGQHAPHLALLAGRDLGRPQVRRRQHLLPQPAHDLGLAAAGGAEDLDDGGVVGGLGAGLVAGGRPDDGLDQAHDEVGRGRRGLGHAAHVAVAADLPGVGDRFTRKQRALRDVAVAQAVRGAVGPAADLQHQPAALVGAAQQARPAHQLTIPHSQNTMSRTRKVSTALRTVIRVEIRCSCRSTSSR